MLVNFFLKSTPLHYERQILTDFADSVGGRVSTSADYEESDIAVIFGSWKKSPKKKWKVIQQHHFTKNDIVEKHKDKQLDKKLTWLILLWILDKIIMLLMLWIMK